MTYSEEAPRVTLGSGREQQPVAEGAINTPKMSRQRGRTTHSLQDGFGAKSRT